MPTSVYLRFELIRGRLSRTQYDDEIALLRNYLQTENKPHFTKFLDAWPTTHS
ncbi:MAG: hypothetical protein H6978_03440 [Gammaproteobacteria bacterium]|nr:hypothetical protein [Gammaproteobacteria bacterium]